MIIIDALDELIDKAQRNTIFDYLSCNKTRWVLSFRESGYQGYTNTLQIENIRIKLMIILQIQENLNKQFTALQHNISTQNKIRNTIFIIINTNAEQKYLNYQ